MLSYLSSYVWSNQDSEFKKKLGKKLRKEGINDEEFFKCLKKTNSVISGSYPLQVYLNEKWDGSDLDIFTDNSLMTTYLETFYRKYEEADGSNYSYPRQAFDTVVGFKTPTKLKLQVIKFKKETKENIVDATHDKFDFDFCMVSFDGEKLHIRHPEAVHSRKCNYDVLSGKKKLSHKTWDRLLKYEKRGFTVTNRDNFISAIIMNIMKEKYYYQKQLKLQKKDYQKQIKNLESEYLKRSKTPKIKMTKRAETLNF